MTREDKMGPNVKKLVAMRMSQLMIPAGSPDPLAAGLNVLLSPNRLKACAREATDWVLMAITSVENAQDNPFGHDHEAIASEILSQVEQRKQQQREARCGNGH